MNKRTNRISRGVVLIFSLSVLALMSFLSIVFIILARTASSATKVSLDYLNAIFLAESGMESAIANLEEYFCSNPVPSYYDPWVYHGEDLNLNYELDETQPNEDINTNKKLDINSCPIELSLLPSFPNYVFEIDGVTTIVSGVLSSAQAGLLNVYKLKIVDTSSLICINNLENEGLRNILNNLSDVLELNIRLGELIFKNKPKTGKFTDYAELKKLVGEEVYNKIRPYVSLFCWEDNKVIKPSYKNRWNENLKPGDKIYSWFELRPSDFQLEPRSPINVNLAEEPVLVSALANLEGIYLEEEQKPVSLPPLLSKGNDKPNKENLINFLINSRSEKPVPIGTLRIVKITLEEAKRIAERIISYRKSKLTKGKVFQPAFSTWSEFTAFLDSLVDEGTISKPQRDIILANCNPNTDFNKFNPNFDLFKVLDKGDLIKYTTEFTLIPTGIFEIESLSYILRGKNSIASSKISGVAKVYDLYRWTSAKDFLEGTISESNVFPTANNLSLQVLPIDNCYTPASENPSLATNVSTCQYDGQLILSPISGGRTIENKSFYAGFNKTHRKEEVSTINNCPSHDENCFINAEETNGSKNIVRDTTYFPNNNPLFFVKLYFPKRTRIPPGTLFPDGIYSEFLATPAYQAEKNFPEFSFSSFFATKPTVRFGKTFSKFKEEYQKLMGLKEDRVLQGTLSFWVKPSFTNKTLKPHLLFSISKTNRPNPTNKEKDITSAMSYTNFFQLFYIPQNILDIISGKTSNHLVKSNKQNNITSPLLFWEHPAVDEFILLLGTDSEKLSVTPALDAHYWTHVAVTWNTIKDISLSKSNFLQLPDVSKLVRLYINGIDVTSDVFYKYQGKKGYYTGALDYTTANVFRFGARTSDLVWNFPADSTFDEIIIAKEERSFESISQEFNLGRYYPTGDGSFISNSIKFKGKRRLGSILWTDNISVPTEEGIYYSLLNATILDETGRKELLKEPISYSSGAPLNVFVDGGFKLKITFRTLLDDQISPPFLETAILDDVTITIITPLSEGKIQRFVEE